MMDDERPDWLPKGLTYAGGVVFGGLIFEFKQMEQAKAFVDAVKERFGLWGQTFDNADVAARHTLYPFVGISLSCSLSGSGLKATLRSQRSSVALA